MKNIRFFYKLLKVWIIIANIFIIAILFVVLFYAFVSGEGFGIALTFSFLSIIFFSILEILLLKYYRNIVISVSFTKDCVVANSIIVLLVYT